MTDRSFRDTVKKIEDNLGAVQEKMRQAALRVGRAPDSVTLVGVTKLVPLNTVRAAIEAGLRHFGENYPEQAVEKITTFRDVPGIQWHMIGHIQSRKADLVCEHFDYVHSVDRLKIARYLEKHCSQSSLVKPVLLEVNVSGEESKYGWHGWDESQWGRLIADFESVLVCQHLRIQGLMSMPPFFDNPEKTRPYYVRLRRLQDVLKKEMPGADWNTLSIGTSFDYEVAIEEGATMVRVGTEIFGSRPTS